MLALSSGLIKLSHSCWTFPEENHRQGRGKGCSSKPSVTAYYGFFILLRGLFGDFGTAAAVLQGQGKQREKQYVVSRDQKENFFASYKWWPSIVRWLHSFCASSFPCQHAEHAHKEGSSIPPPVEYLAQWFPKWSHWNYCGPNVITYSLKVSLSVAHLCTCCPSLLPPAFLPRLSPVHSLLTHTQLLLFCCCCVYSLHFGWLVGVTKHF